MLALPVRWHILFIISGRRKKESVVTSATDNVEYSILIYESAAQTLSAVALQASCSKLI